MHIKKRRESISLTLYIKFIISIIIPTIIISIGYSSYFYLGQKDQNIREANNILITTDQRVEQLIKNMEEACVAPYISSEAFKALPLFINPSLEVDQLRLNEIERNYEEILYKIMFQSSLSIEALTFYPYKDNYCYIVSRASEGISKKTFDPNQESWFAEVQETKNSKIFYSSSLPSYFRDKYFTTFPTLSIATNIRNSNTNKDIGAMVATIRISKIDNVLKSTLIDENDNLILMDSNKIISSSREIDETQLNYLNSDFSQKKINIYKVYKSNIENTDLSIIYLSNNEKTILSLLFFYLISLLLIIVETIIGLVIYRASSKEMVDDINSLLDTMEEIAKGNLEVKAKDSSFEYLQNFSIALNTMAKQLKKTIENEYLAVINRQKAEYMALQSQINPHFLYNTLNGFVGLNRMGEKKKLEKSIISLTKLFRYTCTKSDVVQLSQELNFVKDYFKLQKIKYEDRLNIVYDIEEDTKKVFIPKLILQPLVENAIIHGLEPISKQVTITIKSLINKTESGNVLFICIKDNGVGCTSDKLQLSNSIALNNIDNRIKIFSEGSILTYKCKKNEGVEVYLIIPLGE